MRIPRRSKRRPLEFERLEIRLPLSNVPPIPFVATDIIAGDDGIIYMLSTEQNKVYRWSTQTRAYEEAIETQPEPLRMAFSEDNAAIYLGYRSGEITQIPLESSPLVESTFFVTAGEVTGLEAAGRLVFATDPSLTASSQYVFAPDGSLLSLVDLKDYTTTIEWSRANNRVYYVNERTFPRDLHWGTIDPTTGRITDSGESPYHGDYTIQHPIRISPDGTRVALGSGDIYDAMTIEIETSLPAAHADALWLNDNSLITISLFAGASHLLHRDADYELMNSQVFGGEPIRVLETAGQIVVMTELAGVLRFHEFVPTDDVDADGVDYLRDAFPTDPAASLDSDNDGAPDRWNDGRDAGDSTTGLRLDSFPVDSACRLPQHALQTNPSQCDIAGQIPNYAPHQVVVDAAGIVYLLNDDSDQIFRWSMPAQEHLNPIFVGHDPQHLAYSEAHSRLYVGYDSGKIRQINLSSSLPREEPFAATPGQVTGLQAFGEFVFAMDPTEIVSATNYVFSFTGELISKRERGDDERLLGQPQWEASTNRMYYLNFRDRLGWTVIDPVSGIMTSHRNRSLDDSRVPIRLSPDGQTIFVAPRDFLETDRFQLVDWLEYETTDLLWLTDDEQLTIRRQGQSTLLEHWDADGNLFNFQTFAGFPRHIVRSADHVSVVTYLDRRTSLFEYVPTDDPDQDGVPTRIDAFPHSPSASVDSDRDGFPDAWNEGWDGPDAASNLMLDAFPADSACQLPAHGIPDQPNLCDIAARLPNFVPTEVVAGADGVIYSLREMDPRVYRWSSLLEAPLNPIILTSAPEQIAYSETHDRLFVGHSTGRISQVDLGAPVSTESPLAKRRGQIEGLEAVGPFVFVAVAEDFRLHHYLYDHEGTLLDAALNSTESPAHEWSPANNRLYFAWEISFGSIEYHNIDVQNGLFDGDGMSRRGFVIEHPIRESLDGSLLLLATGEVFDASTLESIDFMPTPHVDAAWLEGGALITIREAEEGQTILEHWDAARRLFSNITLDGSPLRVFNQGGAVTVLLAQGAQTEYFRYVATNDRDGDGSPNDEDAFVDDPAASVDTDRDGFPDAWNAGRSEEDSTTGLMLDAFPNDSACQLPEHATPADPTVCDIAAQIPAYTPTRIVADQQGILYLLSEEHDRIFRYSLDDDRDLNPLILDEGPAHLAYLSTSNRLYVGYDRAVTQFDVGIPNPTEHSFVETVRAITALEPADSFLFLVTEGSGSSGMHYTVAPSGDFLDTTFGDPKPIRYVWNAANRRIYSSRFNLTSRPISETGELGSISNNPSVGVQPPVRVSPDGSFVIDATGGIHAAVTRELVDSLPISFVDALWLTDGSFLTIRREGDSQTLLEHWDTGFRLYNLRLYAGGALRVLESSGDFVVITMRDGRPTFETYLPTNDADDDGTPNDVDAFVLDPSAAVDSDGDGHPDRWNEGYSENNSSLRIDAFPLDSACQLAIHALPDNPQVCDIAAQVPIYEPTATAWDYTGTIYLLSEEHNRIYRWSATEARHLNPIVVQDGSQQLDYSRDNGRVYVGYANGNITEIDPAEEIPKESLFTRTRYEVVWLQAAGPYVFTVSQVPNSNATVYSLFGSDGALVDSAGSNRLAAVLWNHVSNQLYVTLGGSGASFRWTVVDFTRDLSNFWRRIGFFFPPASVSPAGDRFLVGHHLFTTDSLQHLLTLPEPVVDAAWLPNQELVTIRELDDGGTLLEHRDTSWRVVATSEYNGAPLRIVASGDQVIVATQDSGRPEMVEFIITEDHDGDGVAYVNDAFPLDPAAAVDTDKDGAPDGWNAGYTANDSLLGLVLDAFPTDPACQLAEQTPPGQPQICMPSFVPGAIEVDTNGVIYLLDPDSDRVHRWSTTNGEYASSILLGDAPQQLAVSPVDSRLYVGYPTGEITHVDLTSGGQETPFVSISKAPTALLMAGDFVFVSDVGEVNGMHYTFTADGNSVSAVGRRYKSETYAWNSVSNNIYFARDDVNPNDLRVQRIDPASGQIGELRDSPYHGDFVIRHPIVPSPDGTRVILGSSDIYDAESLHYLSSIPVVSFTDALWLDDGGLTTIREFGGQTLLEHWDADLQRVTSRPYDGTPLRIVKSQESIYVVTHVAGLPAVEQYNLPSDFVVTSLAPNDSGFELSFASAIDPTEINLYDTRNAELGAADVVVTGASSGRVAGSLIVSGSTATFVKSGGPLAPDTYIVRLRSARDAFKDTDGMVLDGNWDGVGGDDYLGLFAIDPVAGARTIQMPDIVRGAGQDVDVPADGQTGIPITISDGDNVREVEVQIAYDPAMLEITGATTPAGGSVTVDTATETGLAKLVFSSSASLPAGETTFISLQASVPTGNAIANYGRQQLLDLQAARIGDGNGGEFPVVVDDALHYSAYFADVSGNGRVNASDAAQVARFAALLDGGFTGSLVTDPMLVGDISGNGRLNAGDASLVARFVALFPVDQIPPIPSAIAASGSVLDKNNARPTDLNESNLNGSDRSREFGAEPTDSANNAFGFTQYAGAVGIIERPDLSRNEDLRREDDSYIFDAFDDLEGNDFLEDELIQSLAIDLQDGFYAYERP